MKIENKIVLEIEYEFQMSSYRVIEMETNEELLKQKCELRLLTSNELAEN